MKKIFTLLISLICICAIPVKADTKDNINVLYPINSTYNAVTSNFNYESIIYNSNLDVNGNATIAINRVHNLTTKKVPISIRIALFDSKKKNIGVVNYCSTRDTESDFSYKMLLGNEETSFYVKVTQKKNIAKRKKLEDVSYIAILSDNKECNREGMENKYVGLTIDEIVNGDVPTKVKSFLKLDFIKKLADIDLSKLNTSLIILVLVVFIIYIVQAKILNALHKRMFNSTTALAYIPIGNMYIATKLAFGPLISKIYIITYLLSIFISIYVKSIFNLLSCIGFISFIIVLIKLITKKYNILYFQNLKSMKNKINDFNNSISKADSINNEDLLENSNKDKSTNNDLLASLGIDIHGNMSNTNEEEKDDDESKFFNISPGNKKDSEENLSSDNKDKSDNDSNSLEDFFK